MKKAFMFILVLAMVFAIASCGRNASVSSTSSINNTKARVEAGYRRSFIIKNDGTLWAFGHGKLGETWRSVPAQLSSFDNVLAGASSQNGYFEIVLLAGGSVWTFGDNKYGQLGDGTTEDRKDAPIQVEGLQNIIAVAAGYYHGLALGKDGIVWAWGNNANGQLGNGHSGKDLNSVTPIPISLDNVIAISAGDYFSLALKKDGTVWSWGKNEYGQLGNGSTESHENPKQIENLNNVTAISAGGSHSLVLQKDGTVWAFGYNKYGQLGDGSRSNRETPVQSYNLSDIVEISAGTFHSIALKKDGTVWTWGDNEWYRLARASGRYSETPGNIENNDIIDILSVSSGYDHTLLLKSDGTVWAFGNGSSGQLGDGNERDHEGLKQVVGPTGPFNWK